jgi:CheY-like chemotaxis protein/HPt (histidine-containing phosphotransfer) domain-containing protein
MFRILLAEDNKDNQAVYRRMLEGAGYDIDIVENGREAIEAFRRSSYDLILMDLQMPEMDGMEAAVEIRRLDSGKRIPIVAFTALPPDPHRKSCLGRGMNDFLNKPCDEHTLLSCLEIWMPMRPVILVVDDMKENRRLLKHYLKETPYEFLSAKNGIEAIASFRKESRIALILMDMEMPVMDGYTAARTIRSMMGKNTIPIIAMTAHEGEQEVNRCIKAGCTGYLSKPVTQEALFQMLRKHLKRTADCSMRNHKKNSLENMVVHIDPDIAELVPGFLDNRKRDAEEIRRLLAEGNFEAIRIIGHSIAGSAGGYGFPEIGKLGKAIEAAALAVRPEEIQKKNSNLSEYLSAVTVVEKKV